MNILYLSAFAVVMAGAVLTGCSKSTAETTAAPQAASAAAETTTAAQSQAAESPRTISVTHGLDTVTVPVNPKRVAVLDYSVLETIDYLGATPDMIIPQDDLPQHLKKYKSEPYKNAGDIKEPNVEAINEFKPDLIIIGGRQAALYDEFSKIAPTVYTDIDYTKYWSEVERINLLVGDIFDKKDAVEAKLAELKTKTEEIKAAAEKDNKNGLIILTNDGGLSAFGVGSRFGFIHDLLGIKAVDDNIEVSKHGMEVGFEYVAEKNPDLLFVVDRTVVIGGSNIASKTLDNDLIKDTTAGKNDKIIYLDPGTWYLSGYGLESIPAMFDEVANALK